MNANVNAMVEDPGGAGRRQAARRDMYLWGTVRMLGRAADRLLVLNISKTGFMGETVGDLDRGCFVEVNLPGIGLISACVVWCEKGKVGGRFLRPI